MKGFFIKPLNYVQIIFCMLREAVIDWMNLVYEMLRAGSTQADSDSGAEVARKFNDNFNKTNQKFQEIEQSIKDGIASNIPIGSSTTAGVVKSSDSANKVTIGEDGTMEVVSLDVQKLIQDENDYIILDGDI